MSSVLCHELWSSKEAPPELASQFIGACPTDGRPCASYPANSLFSRSVTETYQDVFNMSQCELCCKLTLLVCLVFI